MIITPLETLYAGCLFRSRLEARWAVFFDVWGLKWRYEPDAFLLPSGRAYLPDFLLEGIGYVECKPSRQVDDGKLMELATLSPDQYQPCFVIYRDVPAPTEIPDSGALVTGFGDEWIINGADEASYWFSQCPACGKKGITYQGRSSRLGCPCCVGGKDRTWNERAVVGMRVAAVAARSMRFNERSNYGRFQ